MSQYIRGIFGTMLINFKLQKQVPKNQYMIVVSTDADGHDFLDNFRIIRELIELVDQ